MVILSKSYLKKFFDKNAIAKKPLLDWYLRTKEADWANLNQLKKTFPATDYVDGLYIFNIGGNKFRLIARITFSVRTVYIRFVGTHADYDKVKLSDL